MELDFIKEKKLAELREIAQALHIDGAEKMKKSEIIAVLTRMHEESEAARAKASAKASAEEDAADEQAGNAETAVVKKKRGRPRKNTGETAQIAEKNVIGLVPENQDQASEKTEADPASEKSGADQISEKPMAVQPSDKSQPDTAPKKKRGRPRKNAAGENQATANAAPKNAADAAASLNREMQSADGKNNRAKENKEVRAGGNKAPLAEEQKEPQASEQKEPLAAEQKELKSEEKKELQPGEKKEPQKDGRVEKTGILELAEGGFGFLRFDNFLTSPEDVYVSPTQIRRFNLKTGDEICGIVRKPAENERFGAILYVKTVNGDEPGAAIRRPDFSELTPTYPEERIVLEKGSSTPAMRLTDIIAPIGKGQRGLIVAPPKAGKTTLLKQIAKAIENQNTGAQLIVLLVDERPEEVTDMKESINGQVIYSTFDEQPSHHVKVAEMVLARAERLCEHGKDVIILLDSITRLARAYNLVEPPSGRTLSGGLDPAALYKPKKFFGAARNTREGGSITILATALVETGSRMDDVIFEEFKGTGNMELHLDRKLQERRIFPALNLNKSGTRREDVLMSQQELEAVWYMRRALSDMGNADAAEKIIFDLIHTKTNAEFIQRFLRTRF